jgi:translation initiation factor 2 alpha subunit (eIF-2alpha)
MEEGEIVLCTVERIDGTIVFVRMEEGGQGTIVTSEIAPGRIRNLREYVVPNKKIVCKVLRIKPNGNVELSLRRVTQKETKELLNQYQTEKSYESIIKNILKDKAPSIIEKIKSQERLYDFIEEAKEKPSKLEKLTDKETANKILALANSQKNKHFIIKKEIKLTTLNENGLENIKNVLKSNEIKIRYIAAGKYSLEFETEDPKKGENIVRSFIENIEEMAKKEGMEFSIVENKQK